MAYSHPSVRLKKYPFISWLTAGFFQGAFTFGMCIVGFMESGFSLLFEWNIVLPALLTTLLLLGSYPLTQVYQHEEDHKRGDITLSLKLGILGTFYFTSIWFLISGLAFVYYFFATGNEWAIWWFLGCTSPLVVYFFIWFSLVKKEPQKYASHKMAMTMNKISASTLNFFFIVYYLAQ
jgi:1,4-dihydroxy-2-naphthoate octaprenyltransferase